MKLNTLNRVQTLLICVISLFLHTNTNAQENNSAYVFNGNFIGEFASNHFGGLKTSSAYLGEMDLSLTLNTENAGFWKSGEFYFQVMNSHGATPTLDYIGDLQVASNIENGNYSMLYQLFYQHNFDKLMIIAGIHDVNAEFYVSDYGLEFIHSSLGVMPTLSMNVPVGIYPKPALGLILKYDFTANWNFGLGLYEGDPKDLDSSPYNIKHTINSNDGILSLLEVMYSYNGSKSGVYKWGGFYHSGEFSHVSDSVGFSRGNYGLHFIANQEVYTFSEYQKLGFHLQYGVSPSRKSQIDSFFSIGFNYSAPFNRENDVFGIVYGSASLNNDFIQFTNNEYLQSEAFIEVVYKYTLSDYFALQADLQYIMNPCADPNLKSSLVSFARVYLSF